MRRSAAPEGQTRAGDFVSIWRNAGQVNFFGGAERSRTGEPAMAATELLALSRLPAKHGPVNLLVGEDDGGDRVSGFDRPEDEGGQGGGSLGLACADKMGHLDRGLA